MGSSCHLPGVAGYPRTRRRCRPLRLPPRSRLYSAVDVAAIIGRGSALTSIVQQRGVTSMSHPTNLECVVIPPGRRVPTMSYRDRPRSRMGQKRNLGDTDPASSSA